MDLTEYNIEVATLICGHLPSRLQVYTGINVDEVSIMISLQCNESGEAVSRYPRSFTKTVDEFWADGDAPETAAKYYTQPILCLAAGSASAM